MERSTWCEDFTRFKKVLLVFFIIAGVCLWIKHSVYLSNVLYIQENYPSIHNKLSNYHSTAEIIYGVVHYNEQNEFYGANDLTPQVTNVSMKIYGYGPVAPPEEYKIRVMIVCGQHGRERVSSELCHSIISLLQLEIRDPVYTEMIQNMTLNDIGIWLVPVANPWARMHVECVPEAECQRTNANGVDLNRNYERYFNDYDEGDGRIFNEEENPGPYPFSEYETVAVSNYLGYVKPHILINVHSGGNDFLLPYDYTSVILPRYYKTMVKAVNSVRSLICPECRVGSSSTLLYISTGTLVDYAIKDMNTQLAYTFEIYESPNATNLSPSNCADFFNPKEGLELYSVVDKWINITLSLITSIEREVKKN